MDANMNNYTKPIEVVPYNADWPAMFDAERAVIAAALSSNCAEIYHVGSTSVPGIIAKPIIDIVAVAKDRKDVVTNLEKVGYVHEGEWNIPLKCGFKKRRGTWANLHVFFDNDHPEIELNLRFRDYLKAHPEVRDAYGALKQDILKDEASQQKVGKIQLPAYTLKKSEFIKSVIKESGFKRLRVLKCMTEEEWNAAKISRQRFVFDARGVQDPYHWTFDDPDHEHFALYNGVEIVGYAHIQLLPQIMEAILRVIVVMEGNCRQGFGSWFLKIIEEWLTVHSYRAVYTFDGPEKFFKKHGYTEMPMEDPFGDLQNASYGKVL
jgi:GrpB-like predicted nucleotidyltransferase (UPF0157 family)/GNAT superfamily N-acetyltransferase